MKKEKLHIVLARKNHNANKNHKLLVATIYSASQKKVQVIRSKMKAENAHEIMAEFLYQTLEDFDLGSIDVTVYWPSTKYKDLSSARILDDTPVTKKLYIKGLHELIDSYSIKILTHTFVKKKYELDPENRGIKLIYSLVKYANNELTYCPNIKLGNRTFTEYEIASFLRKHSRTETLKKMNKRAGFNSKEMAYIINNLDSYIVFDVETTGLSPEKGDELIQIGALKITNGKVVDEFNEFIEPININRITKHSIAKNNITKEMVIGKDKYFAVLDRFRKFIGDLPLIAHNCSFDRRCINLYFWKIGVYLENYYIDSVELARLAFPDDKTHNLSDLAEKFGVANENHHDAMNDTKVLNEILNKLKPYIEKIVNKFNLEERQEYQGSFDWKIKMCSNSLVTAQVFKYWGFSPEPKEGQRKFSGLFVATKHGKVYYDLEYKRWFNSNFAYMSDANNEKGIPFVLDFAAIEKRVCELAKIKDFESEVSELVRKSCQQFQRSA